MTNWATRCNACGTSFRISEEQLKISDGFVRCGRCDAVFDARGSLFDLDAVSAPMPLASAPMPLQPAMAPAAPPPVAAPVAPAPAEFAEPSWQETAPAASSAAPPAGIGAPSDDWRSAPDPSRAEPVWTDPPDLPASEDEANSRLRELLRAEPEPMAPVEPAVFASLQAATKPAPRAGSRRWNAFGGLLAGLLALALPLQWAWIEREALRARMPQLDALLDQQGLHSQGWQQLDGLSVGGSSLQATPQGGAYRLELVLHNRAPHRVAMPWLDLKLSDASGAPLMRRALAPAELGAPQLLQAGEQRRLQAVFKLQGGVAAVNGYEIGLFHP